MSKPVVTVTRRIELRFNTGDKAQRNAWYADLYRWRDICYRGSNIICTHLFVNTTSADFVYMNKKIIKELERDGAFALLSAEDKKALLKAENREIYKEITNEQKDFFETTLQNATYQVVSRYFKGSIPTAILTSLNSVIVQTFNAEKDEYIKGTRSLRIYKKDIPIPFQVANIRNVRNSASEDKVFKDLAFTLFNIQFRTHFGIDLSNNESKLKDALSHWFLPDWIHDLEEQLSAIILTSKVANFKTTLGGVLFDFKFNYLDNNRHEYIVTTGKENKEFVFRMRPGKPEEVAEVGPAAHLVKVDTKGKLKRPKSYNISGEIKLCDSSIQITEKKYDNKLGERKERTKIFLLATLQYEKKAFKADPDKTAYCELDINIPIKVRIGNKVFEIGSRDEYLYPRIGIQNKYSKKQRDLKGAKGGRGRNHKLQALERYHAYEKNYIKGKLHKYSRELIKFCLENNVSTIYLCKQEAKEEEAKESTFLLRNWGFNGLKQFISYKADEYNIEVAEETISTS